MNFAIPAPTQPSISIQGEDARFPVRRIFCVGRNYAAHAREMGADPDREPPFFFTKPADAVVEANVVSAPYLPYPPLTKDLHHEIELTIAIGKDGHNIPAASAMSHVLGYAVSVDLTRRDLQQVAKDTRRPWDWSKGFDHSAPIAPIARAGSFDPSDARIWLTVDGETRQDANLSEMIWPVADIIAFASQSVALKAGDLIMTGTPAGVGAIAPGQSVRGGIGDLPALSFHVTAV